MIVRVLASLAGLLIAATATQGAAAAASKYCGWISNPTPANWSLMDRFGEWVISVQGGYQARGIDLLPEFPDDKWVKTNGYYGYGCACLTATIDQKQHRVISISAVEVLALRTCRQDRALPRPD